MGEMTWNGLGAPTCRMLASSAVTASAILFAGQKFSRSIPQSSGGPTRGLVALPGPGLQLFFVWGRPDAG